MTIPRWEAETLRYCVQVERWPIDISDSTELADLRLVLPLSAKPSRREALGIELVSFAHGGLRAATELAEGARYEWLAGRFVLVTLSVRLMLEFAGAMSLAAHAAERLATCDDQALAAVAQRVARLVAGARSPVALPWGGVAAVPAISVQTFVDSLEQDRPGSADDYAFLSAGSHPCHFQQFYLHMAGSAGDNWSNDIFAAHAHETLARTVSIGDKAAQCLRDYSTAITRTLSPILARHRA